MNRDLGIWSVNAGMKSGKIVMHVSNAVLNEIISLGRPYLRFSQRARLIEKVAVRLSRQAHHLRHPKLIVPSKSDIAKVCRREGLKVKDCKVKIQ